MDETATDVTVGDEVACFLCGCTEDMACGDLHGGGCHWVSHEPPICSACERTWRVIQAISDFPGGPGVTKVVKAACRDHRQEGYTCG